MTAASSREGLGARLATRSTPLIWFVGLFFALAGLTDYSDGIVRYVIGVVDGHPWSELWRPVFDPPPMNTHTYRPLTVALVKLQLLLSARDTWWMTVMHLACIPWFGFAAHRFARSHGGESVALPVALSTMILPSILFSGWISVESDSLGAAFVCEAGFCLQQWRASDRQTGGRPQKWFLLFVLAALGAATTKETSAAAMFGYLLAMSIAYRHVDGRRLWRVTAASFLVLMTLVAPLFFADRQAPHDFNVGAQTFDWSRLGFMFVHNSTQVFYVTSAVGCGLIAVFGLRGRTQRIGLIVLCLALLLCPPLRIYNHYESVIIDQIVWVFPFSLALILSLLRILFSAESRPEHASLAGTVLALGGVLVLAPVLAVQTRPDVSARLYAPAIPALLTLAWLSAQSLRAERLAWLRRTAYMLTGLLAWYPLAGAINGTEFWRARMQTERAAKLALVETLEGAPCPFIIATNRNSELAIEELEGLGTEWQACANLFVPNKVQHDLAAGDEGEWKIQGHSYELDSIDDLEEIHRSLHAGKAPERCTYLYFQSPKAMMETHDFKRFSGDFEWAFGNLPEFDSEVHAQQVEVMFREEIGYQKFMRRAGAVERLIESPFVVLPANLTEVVGRLRHGLPVIETYAYEGRVLALQSCRRR